MPQIYTEEKMQRDFNLLADIEAEPMKTNVTWSVKYQISRERVRQIREKAGLPTVEQSKEMFIVKNFTDLMDRVRNGETFASSDYFRCHADIGNRSFTKVLDKYPELQELYDNAVKDFEYKRANPTEQKCYRCKEIKSSDEFYADKDVPYTGLSKTCKDCNKSQVAHYYKIRKENQVGAEPVEMKVCAGVPELGPLPAKDFYRMTASNFGLQSTCKVFHDAYVVARNTKKLSIEEARLYAKEFTLEHYKKEHNKTVVN